MLKLKNLFKFRNSRGDTIIEVLISIVLLGLILTVAYTLSTHNLSNSTNNNKRNQALAVAQAQVNQLTNAQSSLTSGLTNYRKSYPFCVNYNGSVVRAQTDGYCAPDDNGYRTQIKYDDSTSTFTITTQWPKANSTSTNQVQLFYRSGTYVADTSSGDGKSKPKPTPDCRETGTCPVTCGHGQPPDKNGNCPVPFKTRHTQGTTCGCACYSNGCSSSGGTSSGTSNGGSGGGDNTGGPTDCPCYCVKTNPPNPVDDCDCSDVQPGTCTCFVAGTMVDTPGMRRPIEDIKLGDSVITWDRKNWRPETEKVIKTIIAYKTQTISVVTSGGSVTTTPHHPFWTDHGWVSAIALDPGTTVYNDNGEPEQVYFTELGRRQTVYNIHVPKNIDYFANGLLVHNTS